MFVWQATYTYCSLELYWKAPGEMRRSLQNVTVLQEVEEEEHCYSSHQMAFCAKQCLTRESTEE